MSSTHKSIQKEKYYEHLFYLFLKKSNYVKMHEFKVVLLISYSLAFWNLEFGHFYDLGKGSKLFLLINFDIPTPF